MEIFRGGSCNQQSQNSCYASSVFHRSYCFVLLPLESETDDVTDGGSPDEVDIINQYTEVRWLPPAVDDVTATFYFAGQPAQFGR